MTITNLLILSIISSCFTLTSAGNVFVKRFIDEETIKSDEKLKKLVENNNGHPVAPGFHPYFVIFMKKPNFNEDYHKPLLDAPSDFSLSGPFFVSGTILNRRWVLTRATPIAYYPVTSYWMISQESIPTPVDADYMNTYDVDFVLLHPAHEQGDRNTDLALARTSKNIEFSFESGSVDLGLADTDIPSNKCKLVVWSWFFQKDAEKKVEDIDKGEIDFSLKDEDCSSEKDFKSYYICLSKGDTSKHPCGINSGAPVICDSVLAGVYVGGSGGAVCDPDKETKGYSALKLDNNLVKNWIKYVLTESTDPEAYKSPDYSKRNRTTMKMCKVNSSNNFTMYYFLHLTILLLVLARSCS